MRSTGDATTLIRTLEMYRDLNDLSAHHYRQLLFLCHPSASTRTELSLIVPLPEPSQPQLGLCVGVNRSQGKVFLHICHSLKPLRI